MAAGDDQTRQIRLEASYRNLERAINWIGNADNKALIGLAFQGAILAGLAAAGDALRVQIENQRIGCLPTVELFLLGGFALVLCWSLWKFFHSLFPDVTEREQEESRGSPFFFGTIARMDLDAFRQQMLALDGAGVEQELIKQTHVVAGIVRRKLRDLQAAYFWLAPELALLAIAIVLIEADQKV